MNLVESYQTIKPSIVAFVPKFHPVHDPQQPAPEFPPIFGTGFIVEDGIVATNDHTVRAISKLPKPEDCPEDLWPVNCLLFHEIADKGMATIRLEVLGTFCVKKIEHGKAYYGPEKPDIAFVHVKMKNLPRVNAVYNLHHIKEGREIATAGFPMGTETLTAPGYLHQLTPTLQRGIISAVLPFPCETPHALMINIMAQGGASGSPVFLPETGDVIGVLYAGLEEDRTTILKLPREIHREIMKFEPSLHRHSLRAPTNISFVVPSHYIEKALERIIKDEHFEFPEDTVTLEEYINQAEAVELKRGEGLHLSKWEGLPRKREIKKLKPDHS